MSELQEPNKASSKTIEEINLEKYVLVVEAYAKGKVDYEFSNSSSQHAAIVLSEIIKYASKVVRVYDDILNGDIADKSERVSREIARIVETNRKIHVVVRDGSKCDSNIYKQLSALSTNYPDNVEVRVATKEFTVEVTNIFGKDINFSVADNSFRMEKFDNANSERNMREAFCNFNGQSYARKLCAVFDKYYQSCPPVKFQVN